MVKACRRKSLIGAFNFSVNSFISKRTARISKLVLIFKKPPLSYTKRWALTQSRMRVIT